MIENITSLAGDFAMRLHNPASKIIYKVDSINLLIGDNGTGKTKTIKAIIKELTENSRPDQFAIEGSYEELGIVYYTAAPFHKKLISVNNKKVTLIDASPPRTFVNDTATAAREYQKVAESLNIPNPLLSNKVYDFKEFSFRCARRLYNSRRILSPKLMDLLQEHHLLSRKIATFTTRQRRIEEEQETLLEQAAPGNNEEINGVLSKFSMALRELLDEKAHHSALLVEIKERVINQFLSEAAPKNEKWAVIWIAVITNCLVGTGPNGILHLSQLLYTKDEGMLPNTLKWQRFFSTIKKLLKILKVEKVGSFQWTKENATVSVDILKLLESKEGANAFEEAHREGLVAFGFEAVSSGEAAILNQLTSITNSIHEIKKSGKKRILLFIDEGDILLHLSWQRRYLSLLNERLGYLKSSEELESLQVVVATHSPLLASDALRGSVTRMQKIGDLPTFGAPIQSIINRSFDTPSIGEIAEREILRLQNEDKYSASDLVLIEEIDDDFIRQYLKKLK
jgi:hypothetical protein